MTVHLAFGWRDVLFVNWPADADVVDANVPDAFDVQTCDGDAWLSAIPFVNVDVRPRGLPAWAGVDLPELNLRTYVTHDGEPGVYFFSLDADSLASVLGARLTHHLPYYNADVDVERRDGRVHFESRRRHAGARPARFVASYEPEGESFEAEPDTLAHFLTERRRLWTESANGAVRYTDVTHERWPLYDAGARLTENTLLAASGFEVPEGEPTLYYSPGVDVVTTGSRRWDDDPLLSPESGT